MMWTNFSRVDSQTEKKKKKKKRKKRTHSKDISTSSQSTHREHVAVVGLQVLH